MDNLRTKQALVAIGGHASRLKKDGINVPLSKSFLELNDKPLLYWCLFFLHQAGIRKIVLAANTKSIYTAGENLINELPFKFDRVDLFLNEDLGADAICYQARHLLDNQYFFECGHSFFTSSHYQQMDRLKDQNNIIFMAFNENLSEDRQFIETQKDKIKVVSRSSTAICSPMLIDQNYANTFRKLNFDLDAIINQYGNVGRLLLVNSDMPIEFNTLNECKSTLNIYKKILKNYL